MPKRVFLAIMFLAVSPFARPGWAQQPRTARPPAAAQPPATQPMQRTGPVEAHSENFVTMEDSDYPLHGPYVFRISDSTVRNSSDNFFGLQIERIIRSGTQNYLAPGDGTLDCGAFQCDNNQNASGLKLTMELHSPIQNGGTIDNQLRAYAPGDSIWATVVNRYTGISRSADEGARLFRAFVYPTTRRWGGRLTSLAPADVRGNVAVQVDRCDGCDLSASSEWGAPLIDITRRMRLGNAVRMERFGTTPFMVVTVDGEANRMGLSTMTRLTREVNVGHYLGECGTSSWHQDPSDPWLKPDPFIAGENGLGNKTGSYCWEVESTAGLTPGTVVVVAGNRSNLEKTLVAAVMRDGHHFVANARMPHAKGEYVSWGGLAGWAGGFDKDIVPRGKRCNGDEGCNGTELYVTPLIVGSLSAGRLLVWGSADSAGGLPGMITAGLATNTPVLAAHFGAATSGGKVTGIVEQDSGDYRTSVTESSGQHTLPAPAIDVLGCRIAPKVQSTLEYRSGKFAVVPRILSPGEGCPATPEVRTQASYENPFSVYPATLVYRAIDEHGENDKGFERWMPVSGKFALGDQVLASTWQYQHVGDLISYGRDLGYTGGTQGPFNYWFFHGQGEAQAFLQIADDNAMRTYYGDPGVWGATNDGGGLTPAPAGINFAGALSTVFNVFSPPRRDVLGTPGTFVNFACGGGTGIPLGHPCESGVLNPFHFLRVDATLGGVYQEFLVDPTTHNWSLNLGGGRLQTDGKFQAASVDARSMLCNGDPGKPGEVLSSTGTGCRWMPLGEGSERRADDPVRRAEDSVRRADNPDRRKDDQQAAALQQGQAETLKSPSDNPRQQPARPDSLAQKHTRSRDRTDPASGFSSSLLRGVTGEIGGSPMAVGNCAFGSAAIPGASVGSPVVVAAIDGSLPNALTFLSGAVNVPGVVTVQLCAAGSVRPAPKRYNVRVLE